MGLKITAPFLSIGFLAILGLMVLLTAISLRVIDSSMERTETIVRSYNQKTNLVNRMHTAARERILSLNKMALMDDPFTQDEEWLEFNARGTAFVIAKEELLTLPLTETERGLLDKQGEVTRELGPLQTEIAQLLRMGENERARRLLLDKAIPLQAKAFQLFNQFRKMQEQASEKALQEAKAEHERTYQMILVVATSVCLFSLFIAVFVIRKSADTEARLRKEKRRAMVTLHSIGDGVITTDLDGKVDQINDVAHQLTGVRVGDVHSGGLSIDRLFSIANEATHMPIENPVCRALKSGHSFSSEGDTVLVRRDGSSIAIEYTVSPIRNRDQQMVGAILVFRDVTEMRALSRQLSYHASHDPLTGLHNRREFESTLGQTLSEVRRNSHLRYWLCYLDLDQFKVINDTCGHIAGDELLKQISMILKRSVRDSDLLARMGGDEFAVLIKHIDSASAEAAVERLRQQIQELRFVWDNKSFSVSASIGLVAVDAASGNVKDLFSAADTACFISKEEGRNRVHVYQSDDDTTAKRQSEMDMVHRINKALEEDRFVLYSQRIQTLQNKEEGMHAEVLVRMLDEEGRVLSPMAFIPAAERYNLMSHIDRWVVKNAIQQLSSLNARGKDTVSLSINLSAQALGENDFHEFVLQILQKTNVDPRRLCFEITETAAIANLSRAIGFIRSLKDLGCYISLDDFGSGLSSFGYLKNMPVDYLKIDGCFIQDILDDPMDRAFVESINQIGHVIGIQTIAEYVDHPDKESLLRTIGVDYAQGYHIHTPEPLHALLGVKPAEQVA